MINEAVKLFLVVGSLIGSFVLLFAGKGQEAVGMMGIFLGSLANLRLDHIKEDLKEGE